MKRRTSVVEGPLAYRMRRHEAAIRYEVGLEILTLPQLASRLAGGFARVADGPALFEAIDTALKREGYGRLDGVRLLPGMARAVVETLTAAWHADVDLELATPRSQRLDEIGLLQKHVRENLPVGVMTPPALRNAAVDRIAVAEQVLGSVLLDGLVDVAPVWRPLISALVDQIDVEWSAAPCDAVDRVWFRGRLHVRDAVTPLSVQGDVCADPRSEVVEALRWARSVLARGDVAASDVAISSPATDTWDPHFLVLAKEAELPLHFSHGIPALSSPQGQACAALADVLSEEVTQERIRRLLRRLPKTPAVTRVPADWDHSLPRRAGLRTVAQWRRAFEAARAVRAEAAIAEAAVMPIVELAARGTAAASEAGKILLAGESRAIWDEALQIAPAAAVALTLQTLRVPDGRDPANSIVWCPAAHLAAWPRLYTRLIGLTGRSWPRVDREDALLPDHILSRRIVVPVSNAERDRRNFSLIAAQTGGQLSLSRSERSAEGSLLSQSPLWPANLRPVVRARTRVPEHAFSETDRLLARPEEAGNSPQLRSSAACWRNRRSQDLTEHDGLIRRSHPAVVRALERVHSTTSLRRLLRDPLGFVWRYALGWRSVPYLQQPLSLTPLEFGELIHELLRLAVTSLEPTPGCCATSVEQIEAALAQAAEAVSVQWPAERHVPPPLLWQHTLDEAVRLGRRGLTVDDRFLPGTSSWTELSFGRSGSNSDGAPWDTSTDVNIGSTCLRFGGRIDRVDVVADGSAIRISDYKSGKRPIDADEIVVAQGTELQRVLYGMAARQLRPQAKVVARLIYLDGDSSPLTLGAERLNEAADDIAHFIAEARRLVEAGHAVPGPDARDKWNDMRLAHPADLSPYLSRKQEAYDALSDELSRLWGRR